MECKEMTNSSELELTVMVGELVTTKDKQDDLPIVEVEDSNQ